MTLTPERKAELRARIDAALRPKAKPKAKVELVVSDARVPGQTVVVRSGETETAPGDPGTKARGTPKVSWTADGLMITKGRLKPGEYRMAGEAYIDPRVEREVEAQRYARALDRQRLRNADPYNLGLYGPIDDEAE
jgi:hypothetical protein